MLDLDMMPLEIFVKDILDLDDDEADDVIIISLDKTELQHIIKAHTHVLALHLCIVTFLAQWREPSIARAPARWLSSLRHLQ
jgi:hypothetical protein